MAPAEQDHNPPSSFLETLRSMPRWAASALASRMDFANRAGLSFGGARDMYQALGYDRELTPAKYRDRYDRNGVATRIVETFPRATWRSGGSILDDEDPHNITPFEEAWLELDTRLQLWPAFARTDILAGLGEYAVLLIGVAGEGDLEEELPETFSAEDVIYTASFSQEDVEIFKLVDDAGDPRFSQPMMYNFKRIGVPRGTTATSTSRSGEQKVHWSRVIHVADGLLDDRIHGTPRLRNVWNLLDDLDKIAGGGAEAFWLRAHQGYVANLDKDLEWDEDDVKDVQQQVEDFANQMRRTIGQRGVEFKAMGSDVADISNNVQSIMSLISAAKGIPVRILTGSERGELASSQDKINFDDRTQDRRDNYAEPVIVRPFIDRLLEHGALPDPIDDDYMVRWPQLENLDEREKASVAVMYATVNRQMDKTVITRDEIRERVLDLPPADQMDEIINEELEKQEARDRMEAIMPPPGAGGDDDAADEDTDGEPRGARVAARRKKKASTG